MDVRRLRWAALVAANEEDQPFKPQQDGISRLILSVWTQIS